MKKLPQARQKANVDTQEVIPIIYQSTERYNLIKKHLEDIKKDYPRDEVFKFYEMSRLDQIRYAYKALAKAIEAKRADYINHDVPHELFHFTNFVLPAGISTIMVRPIIEVLGNETQRNKWLPLLDSFRCIGAYAQTELAHGSDVQHLQTEAVYNPKTNTFTLNNKEIQSYKWWPGELGHLSNIAIVYAKTIVNGKKVGVLPFIVQIRDFETHKVLKGVNVGDIGSKFGYAEKENGFLWFDNYEVPRSNLLNRFFDISEKGSLKVNGNPKIMYAAMMKVRVFLVHSSGYTLGKGLAVAIRYANIRSQFKNEDGVEETIINYQLQQYKLFPLLAKTYAIIFGYQAINDLVLEINQKIQTGDFSKLQECHILLSGAKAMYTWWTNSGLTVCMQCCGGHGYSHYSGIPYLITSFSPNCILEGENTILLMQVGRYLMKCAGNILRGKTKKIVGHITYLLKGEEHESFKVENSIDFIRNPMNMLRLLQKGCYHLINHTLEHFMTNTVDERYLEAFNKKSGIRIFECAKLHTIMFTLEFFIKKINSLPKTKSTEAFTNLSLLFAIEQVLENCNLFTAFDMFNGEFVSLMKEVNSSLLESLKYDSLVLAEIFAPDDYMLFSAIVDQNETPYNNLYTLAKTTGMSNQVDLTDYYLKTIRQAALQSFPMPKL